MWNKIKSFISRLNTSSERIRRLEREMNAVSHQIIIGNKACALIKSNFEIARNEMEKSVETSLQRLELSFKDKNFYINETAEKFKEAMVIQSKEAVRTLREMINSSKDNI